MAHLLKDPEIWVLVSFVTFFVLFGGKLWAVATAMLDGRATAIRAELDEAHRLRAEAEAMLRDAETAREKALAEAAEILARSKVEAQNLADSAHAEAEASGRRRERMALDRIAAAEKAALAEVRQTAADIATRAAAQVIAQGFGGDAENALIDHAIAGLPKALRAA